MASITIPGFSGVVRILAPQRLEDHQATVADNCDFRTQDLSPLKGLGTPLAGAAAGPVECIYLYSKNPDLWLRYDKDVDFARTPYEDKQYGRLYLTGLDFPIVMDNTIVNNTWPSNYRRIGLPAPWNGGNPPTPEPDQGGNGPVASVSFTSGVSSTNPPPATVTCGEAHGLKEGSFVTLDYPGIPARSYQITLSGVDNKTTQYKLKTLGIPGTKTASAKRQSTANQPIIITWSGHGLENGDIVRVGRNVAFGDGNPTLIFTNTDYTVELLDAGRFTLRNGATPVTASGTGGSAEENIPMARINSSANPGVVSNASYTGTTKTFTVVYAPDTANSTNTWTRTDVLETQVDRSYVFTLVNGYGEEGPPSKPTEPTPVTPDTSVPMDLSWAKDNATASLNLTNPYGYNVTKLRIYRTDATGTFRLLPTVENGNTVYERTVSAAMETTVNDTALDSTLGEPLSTQGWAPPPDDLKGITALPNGVMVGFRQSASTGKTVCASVPFHPYAWPVEYRINTESFIVGLAPTATGLVVLTDAMPYVITGTDPASWSAVKLEAQEPCLSKRSIVDMGDYAMYASPNGLIAIAGAEVKNALANVMTREQWQDYNPSTIVGSFYNGRYIGSYVSGSVRKSFVFNPADGSFTDAEFALHALWNDQKTGKLWVLTSTGGICEWGAGSDLTYTWKSKLFLIPKPLNFASMQVLLEDYAKTTTVQVYVSDAKIPLFQAEGVSAPKTLTDNAPFRLPSGYMSQAYQVELVGTGRVRAVGIATAVDELKLEP